MDLTGGARATAGAAGTATTGGLVVVLYGTLDDNLARTLAGTCLTLVALTVLALVLIRQWIVDTRDERRILAAAQRQAEGERTRYIASQAALENEQGRLNRDMAAERYALTARLNAEREKLAAEFEERRAALIAETMEVTVRMMRDGKLAPAPSTTGNLIPFPHQHPQPETTRARSREHGVGAP